MTLETAVLIGARRSGADMQKVDVRSLAGFGERAARAIHVLAEGELDSARDLVRVVLSSEKHPSHFEGPINEHTWFEFFWSNVKYPEVARANRRRAFRLLPGGNETRPSKRRRAPRLRSVQGGAQ